MIESNRCQRRAVWAQLRGAPPGLFEFGLSNTLQRLDLVLDMTPS